MSDAPPVSSLPGVSSVTPVVENVTTQAESHTSLPASLSVDRDIVCGLYVFAGRRRRCDFDHYLQQLAARVGQQIMVVELDLEIDADHDVTKIEVWLPHKQKLASRHYKFLIITPPCNTTSRATYSNPWGAKPTRNVVHPLGFPWLTGALKAKVETANVLFEITWDACLIAHRVCIPWFIEHPEDLGATWQGERPASFWQSPRIIALLGLDNSVVTDAFFLVRRRALFAWQGLPCR